MFRNICTAVVLSFVLLAAVLVSREWAYSHCDPYWIDYDAPGIDITSEGP